MIRPPNNRQIDGSEYGGTVTFAGGVQPKGTEALTPAEKLKLGYLTGNEESTDIYSNLEDRRQALGLRPATGKRPTWMEKVSPTDDSRLISQAQVEGFS